MHAFAFRKIKNDPSGHILNFKNIEMM